MLYLGCYDIETDSVRSRVAEQLLTVGMDRMQFSVFVGPLTKAKRQRLLNAVEKLLYQQPNAHFVLLPLMSQTLSGFTYIGVSEPDWSYLSGEKQTLII